MSLYIFLLIIATLIQTSFLPLNLCLILIISKSLIREETADFYLAFFIGIILGVLSLQNIGYWAFSLVVVIKFVSLIRKLPISSSILTVLPISAIILIIFAILEKVIFTTPIDISKMILESLVTLPTYVLLRFWDERFIARPIKLKIKE